CNFFFSSRRRHTRSKRDWSSDVCSSDLLLLAGVRPGTYPRSGSVHLRLWLAEHIADLAAAVSVASAPWVSWYARLLGNSVGRDEIGRASCRERGGGGVEGRGRDAG